MKAVEYPLSQQGCGVCAKEAANFILLLKHIHSGIHLDVTHLHLFSSCFAFPYGSDACDSDPSNAPKNLVRITVDPPSISTYADC